MRQATVKRTTTKVKASPQNRIENPLKQETYSNEEFIQQVREMAYHLYVARGCAHGFDVDDWLAAEQIVRGS